MSSEEDNSRIDLDRQTELASGVLRRLRKFEGLDLGVAETEILGSLMNGRRTSKELVFEIYGTRKEDQAFIADYYKIRRAIKNLQGKGYVTAPLLGKEKLYRFTPHGIALLATIAEPESASASLTPRKDIALYIISLVLGFAIVLSSSYGWDESVSAVLVWCFLVSVGASLVRLLETYQRVA